MANSDCVIIFPKNQSRYSGFSADRSLNYLEKHNVNSMCYDMSGRPLAGVERRALVDYGNECGFRRMGTLSLRWGNELSDQDYHRAARKFFSEFARDRDSLRVAYSIHRNTEHNHIQFVLTGEKEDCWVNKKELTKLRERGREVFRDRDLDLERDFFRSDREFELDRELSLGCYF